MSIQTSNVNIDKSLIAEITKLAHNGMTDRQIGRALGKHYKTVIYYRKKYGIDSGRSYKAELSKQRRMQVINRRSYKLMDGDASEQTFKSKIKHGLNAYTPITCKGASCPYRNTCDIPDEDLFVGEPCIVEIAVLVTLTEKYRQQFHAKEGDVVDSRIRHLVDIEIKLMRCDKLIAQNPEMMYIEYKEIDRERYAHKRLNPILRYDLLLMKERLKIIKDIRLMAGGASRTAL